MSQRDIVRAKHLIESTPVLLRLYNQLVAGETFCVIVGAGCSADCGLPSFHELKRRVLLALTSNIASMSSKATMEVDISAFDRVWENAGPSTRHSVLSNWFISRPARFGGYYSLALLIKSGYFRQMVTYNIDDYLELALHSVGFDSFLVLINGVSSQKYLYSALNHSTDHVILKTHGDHRHKVYALSQKEIISFGEKLRPSIAKLLTRKLLIIGFSAEDIDFVRSLAFTEGEEIWFVNPSPPSAHIETAMQLRNSSSNWIQLDFAPFVEALYYALREFDSDIRRDRIRASGGKSRVVARKLVVPNKLGLHARTAAYLVSTVQRFSSEISLEYKGITTNAKSIMGLLMLGAEQGAVISVRAEGSDANAAIRAIQELFESGFYED